MNLKSKNIQISIITIALILFIAYLIFLSTIDSPVGDIDKDGFLNIKIVGNEKEFKKIHDDPFLEEYIIVDVEINGQILRNCGLRTKGSSSYKGVKISNNTTKYGYRLEFDYTNKSQSYNGVKKVYINNGIYDKTCIREMIAFDIYELAGVATPKRSLAEVCINEKNNGIYTIVEIAEEDFLQRTYGNTSGIIYKPKMKDETTPENEKSFWCEGNEITDYPAILEGEFLGRNINKKDLDNLTEALKNIKEEENFEEYVDINSVLDYLAVSFFMPNEDSFISESFRNFYIYQDGKKITILPFDLNLYLLYANSHNIPIYNYDIYLNLQTNPLIYKLLTNEGYREEYTEKIVSLINKLEKDNWLIKRMDFYFNKIEESIKTNSNNFYNIDSFIVAKQAFKDIFNSRIRSVKKQLEENIHNKQINYEPEIEESLTFGL